MLSNSYVAQKKDRLLAEHYDFGFQGNLGKEELCKIIIDSLT